MGALNQPCLKKENPGKQAFLYAHHLQFDQALAHDVYDADLVAQIKGLQKQLGLEQSAIIDLPLLVALSNQLHAADPVLLSTGLQEG